MSEPDTAVNFRDGSSKETQYTFSQIFDHNTEQKYLFKKIALPMVEGLFHGKNGLLFNYGRTGSGKTFTMTGTPHNSGIMPRALDVLFNSISNVQANRFTFKTNRFNGFYIGSEEDAKAVGLNKLQPKKPVSKTSKAQRHDNEWANRIVEENKIEGIDEDNVYAVFVTYVEIYNNSVFDLLDENCKMSGKPRIKFFREDGDHNLYVYGVSELEVISIEEALEALNKGLSRKKVSETEGNMDSSRSHSIFTVRLVRAPLGRDGKTILQDRKNICISQLSFLDLAGNERTSGTNASGKRSTETGKINNSLMTLKQCLEIIHENERNGTKKLIPYRDSKLTHFIKNFLEGESIVRVILCVNPRSKDYNETLQTMQFGKIFHNVKVNSLLSRCSQSANQVATLESQLVSVEVECSASKKQSSGYERVIKRLQEEVATLKSELGIAKASLRAFSEYKREIKRLQEEIQEKDRALLQHGEARNQEEVNTLVVAAGG